MAKRSDRADLMLSERDERCFWNVSLSEKSNEDGKGVSAAVIVRKYQPLNTQITTRMCLLLSEIPSDKVSFASIFTSSTN